MSNQNVNEPMLEMYLYETTQILEQLEQVIMDSEKHSIYSEEAINEIFRFMHTIKGSSAMMLFNDMASLAHKVEDVFYFLREEKPQGIDCGELSELVLESVDFIKVEVEKIKDGQAVDGNPSELESKINKFLSQIKSESIHEDQEKDWPKDKKDDNLDKRQQYYITADQKDTETTKNKYKATIYFEDGCEMENIRAYAVVHSLLEVAKDVYFIPEDIAENEESINYIKKNGFKVFFGSDYEYEEMNEHLMKTVYIKKLVLEKAEEHSKISQVREKKEMKSQGHSTNQVMISVNVQKLDRLMDLVGEMVIAEAMVTQNPEVKALQLDNFHKAARQLHKITAELQDAVMSIRMVPLSSTFLKMHRITRDMCKKLNKEVSLEVIGEETEVDKNIIEHISDPLMHLIRNAIDHGIEDGEERVIKGKNKEGRIILEAKNSGSDVLIIIQDDGKGLSKEKILEKAKQQGLLIKKESEMTDKEIYNLVLLPGFSTKEDVTEFSGRGVGMDVVKKNIETVGGTVLVDSAPGNGTTITLKIPLTLAIIDGMNIKVGNSRYTIPLISIKESFRPKENECFVDPDGNEMIMVRGECYRILRLHKQYSVNTEITNFHEGILIMVEQSDKTLCLFADKLIGQQQVVVKPLPNYIKNIKDIEGLAGCTLLGDGSISLILNVEGLLDIAMMNVQSTT